MQRLLITSLLLTMSAILAGAQEVAPREIGRTTERELKVVLSSTLGSVAISRGESGKVVLASEEDRSVENPRIGMDYSIRNRIGYLDVTLGDVVTEGEGKKRHLNLTDLQQGSWKLRFSDAVPISFDVELGAGKGLFDLSGLQIKDFNLSTGASDVALWFDQPNPSTIDNLNIESGVSKFVGRNLGNANFKRFRFQGGLGTYSLDFSGNISAEVDVDVEMGFGLLTIYVPWDVGARVSYVKNWVSRIECDNDFVAQGEDLYVTSNFDSARGKMNVRIDSTVGNIAIRRR